MKQCGSSCRGHPVGQRVLGPKMCSKSQKSAQLLPRVLVAHRGGGLMETFIT